MERLALLAVTAHPADELLLAGTLARHAQAGVHVALACATGGHGTEEHDLRCACMRLGVSEVHLLGYGASQPEPAAGRQRMPLALAGACEAVGRIVQLIRSIRPQVMVTFGPDGVDGAAEHVAVGDLATQAFGAAGDLQQFPADGGPAPYSPAKLFYFGLPQGLLRLAGLAGPATPDDAIAARDDVTRLVDLKVEAGRCYHHLAEPGWATLFQYPPAERLHLLGVEFLSLVQPQPAVDDRSDPHLFAGIP